MALEVSIQLFITSIVLSIVISFIILQIGYFKYSQNRFFRSWVVGWAVIYLFASPSLIHVSVYPDLFDFISIVGIITGFSYMLMESSGVITSTREKIVLLILVLISFIYYMFAVIVQMALYIFYFPIVVYSGIISLKLMQYLKNIKIYSRIFNHLLFLSLIIWVFSSLVLAPLLLSGGLFTIIVPSLQGISIILLGTSLFGITLNETTVELKNQFTISQLMSNIIGHDIRNYLQGAMHTLELAKIDQNNIDQWLYTLENILSQATGFVNEIREISSTLIHEAPQNAPTNLHQIVNDVLSNVVHAYDISNLEIVVTVPDHLLVNSNLLLRQIILNIVDNSLRLGTKSLKIEAADYASHVELIIDERAGGVSQSIIDFINMPDISTMLNPPGRGLGLVIIRLLSPLCGVNLSVSRLEDSGSRWSLIFEKEV